MTPSDSQGEITQQAAQKGFVSPSPPQARQDAPLPVTRPQGSATRGITSVTFADAGEMVSRPGLAWRPERTGDPLLFMMQRVDGTSRGSTGTHCLASCNG